MYDQLENSEIGCGDRSHMFGLNTVGDSTMKKKKYGMTVVCMTIGIMMIAVSCDGKKKESTDTEVQTAVVVETQAMNATEAVKETESALPAGEMYSYLTGEPVSEIIGKQRPYAIMINNIETSLPQSGVSQAEMIYEAQVESGITRLMAVFQDVDNIEKIGSIRSARHYYIDFANDNDAIYVHYGQSKYALSRIEDDNIMTIYGLSGYESKVFYRSSDRKAPHNVYTTGKMLAEGLEVTGLTRDYPEGYTPRLQFNHVDTELKDGINAQKVNIPFDSEPYFTYNTEDGLYYRYQYGEAHIDRENDQQLTFKNIIVQYVNEKSISNQDHQDMTLNGSGKGLYITDGKAEEITWKRNDNADKTKYYNASGNEISLNPGKTFFEAVSDSKTVTLE